MANYSYTLTNKKGENKKGTIEAPSSAEAVSQVRTSSWYITSLTKKSDFRSRISFLNRETKFTSMEQILFTDHLAAMFRSGTPVVDALETFKDDENSRGTTIIEELIKAVEQGKKLSEALDLFPKTFSPLYLALVQSGELTGNLDETLAYLAKELKRDHEFKERIKSALLYPIIVLAAALVVVTFLTLVVIPKITEIAETLGGDMPLMTRIIAKAASALTFLGPVAIILIIVAIIAGFFLLKNNQTKKKVDPYLLRLPLIGKLIEKYVLARFLRILGSCLKYGIPFNSSLDIIIEVVGNSAYQQACERIKAKVLRGVNLSKALSEEKADLFPRGIVRSLRGAEKIGNVDEAMMRLSQFYEESIDRELKRITDLMEPALVIVLGIIVAAIAIAVVAPIYQLTSRIK